MIAASRRSDVADLIARVGLDTSDTRPRLVDADSFYAVIEEIVSDGDVTLPYAYGETVAVDDFGVLGLAIKTAPDLGGALERAERYAGLLGDAVHYELRADARGGATFIVGGRPAHRRGVAVANEGALAALLAVCRQAAVAGTALNPVSVSFAHEPIGSVEPSIAYFGCPVRFGAPFDGLHLDTTFLAAATRLADEGLSSYLLDQLEHELELSVADRSLESRVRHVVANGLADGVPPMRVVAQRLAMSERTLQRRLAEEDLRYQDLVVDVRQTVATALLTTTTHSLLDIAFLTGFSDQSAFQRAFKRWVGRTPLEVRRA